jgi:hypothetical protein
MSTVSPLEAARRRENTKMISDLMKAEKVKGNAKDYVVIAGYRLTDWAGEHDLHRRDDEGNVGTIGVDGVALVHKRNLEKLLGPDVARQFWSKKLRRRRAPQCGSLSSGSSSRPTSPT